MAAVEVTVTGTGQEAGPPPEPPPMLEGELPGPPGPEPPPMEEGEPVGKGKPVPVPVPKGRVPFERGKGAPEGAPEGKGAPEMVPVPLCAYVVEERARRDERRVKALNLGDILNLVVVCGRDLKVD